MGIDRSDDADADAPSPEPSDHSPDRADPPAADGGQSSHEQIEPRSRDEYYTQLHATTNPEDQAGPADRSEPEDQTEPADRSEPGSRSKTGDTTENDQQAPEKASDEPPAEPSHHSADRADAPADDRNQPRRDQVEPHNRKEPSADLRAATESEEQTEPTGRSEPGARAKPGEPAENGKQTQTGPSWEETVEESRWIWGEYKRHFPSEERPPVDTSSDEPGSWRGEGDRYLDPPTNERIEAECDRIEDREKERIIPALRAVEGQDPHRHLVGLEHHLKGRDRIKEKIYGTVKDFHRSPEQAVSLLPDTLRYTFQYEHADYTQGVYADIARLQGQGLKLEICKNTWSDDQYKGVNSQWIEPVSGQRFELQFHTRISYEAKQLTHPAYERIRAVPKPNKFEQMVLEAFQRKVTAGVPIPPGATDIPDYPQRGADAR